ncbi:MAG: hypothetical protein HQK52_05985 [Oligoflexia bacterium]|nr:hypothetical protein [Oligoflexia bacterium]
MGARSIEFKQVGDHWRFLLSSNATCEVRNGDERISAMVSCKSFGFGLWEQFLSFGMPILYTSSPIDCNEIRGSVLMGDEPVLPKCDAAALQSSLRELFPANGTFNWEHESDDIILSSGVHLKLLSVGP